MKKTENLPEFADDLGIVIDVRSWDLRFNDINYQGYDFTAKRNDYDLEPSCINPEPPFDEYH